MFKRFSKFMDPFYLIAILAFALRFINLGYSDYQGDEIKALFLPEKEQSTVSFLLDQRKGPVQFLITYLLKFITPNYDNEFVSRFLFALAGFLAVLYFYKFVNIHFGKKVAFFASFFFATNGFFVAFSRIVQYQSFVILFMVLALYFLSLAVTQPSYKFKGLYLGLICWSFSILSHYDGVFIAPFVAYLLVTWFKLIDIPKTSKIKHFLISGLIATIPLLMFYIPFLLALSSATLSYWQGRISGDVSSKVSSSKYLFSVYQPIYVLQIYLILFCLGLFKFVLRLLDDRNLFVRVVRFITKDKTSIVYFWVFAWLLVPFIFMEVFVNVPGTHIYTYLVPVFIFLALGITLIEDFVTRVSSYFYYVGLTIALAFIFAQSYMVFVDNSIEYPWENKPFLFWTLPKPSPVFHLSMFGFPYYRNWEGIKYFTQSFPNVDSYSTNERESLARYYVSLNKSSDRAGFYVYIKNPQTFTNEINSTKVSYWITLHEPVYTYTKNGQDMVRIYLMEPGTLQEIQAKGY